MEFPIKTDLWANVMAGEVSTAGKVIHDLGKLEDMMGGLAGGQLRKEEDRRDVRGELSEKKLIAANIYYGIVYGYGFEEALQMGNWTPLPDECFKNNCFGQALANYLVSEKCSLNPRFVEFVGLKEDKSSHRVGHSNVFVDVGEDGEVEEWLIDQSLRFFGPVTIEGNSFRVENMDAIQGRTIRNDFRTVKYSFVHSIVSNKEEILAHLDMLNRNPECVLYGGQRIGIPLDDRWQSKEALEAPWYLKFISDGSGGGEVVSRILMDRPGIRSKGLEYGFKLNENGNVGEERVRGYYCDGMVWADFTNPVKLVDAPPEVMGRLSRGLAKMVFGNRGKFERGLMDASTNPNGVEKKYIDAARESFDRVVGEVDGQRVIAISLVEALYQDEVGNRKGYLTKEGRERALVDLKDRHLIFSSILKAKRRIA